MSDPSWKNEEALNQGKPTPKPVSGGATDIFGTYSLAGNDTADEELATLLGTGPAEKAGGSALEPVTPVPTVEQPVVHERLFRKDATEEHGAGALRDLLKTTPPAPPVAAPSPRVTAPVPAATAVPNSGFTQLLRALNYDQPPPKTEAVTAAEPVRAAAPVAPSAAPSSAPAAVIQPPLAAPAQSPSITQLLRTIDEAIAKSEAYAPPVAPMAAPVAPGSLASPVASFHAAPLVPQSVEATAFEAVAAREALAAPVPLPVTAPSPTASKSGPGSFTQMFSALEAGGATPVEARIGLAAETAADPKASGSTAAPVAPGSFTQMFQALEATPTAAVDSPKEAADAAALMADAAISPEVERYVAPPPPPVTPAAAAASPRPGSFTQLFRALDISGAAPVVEPVVARPADVGAVASAPVRAGGEGGSFTQMFRTLDAAQATMEQAAMVSPAASAPGADSPGLGSPSPGSFTQMFKTLDAPAGDLAPTVSKPVEAAAPPVSAPSAQAPPVQPSGGSFTQLFRALDPAPAVEASSPVEAVRGATAENLGAGVGPSSFTQMFSASAYAEPEPQRSARATSEPGAFTQMFSTQPTAQERAAYAAPPAAAASGGSFTQLFGTLDAGPAESARVQDDPYGPGSSFAAPGLRPAATVPASDAGLGASQVFSTPPAVLPAPAYRPPVQVPQAPPPGSGGLTQLLRTLDEPSAAKGLQRFPDERPAPAPAATQPGSFTAAYSTLDAGAPTAAEKAIPSPAPAYPAAQAAPVSAGPSEFTRILNASALREAQMRPGGGPGDGTAAPAAGGGFSLPGAPQMPVPPLPQAQMPPMASPPTGGGGAPAPQFAMPAMPAAPAIPQMKAPEVKMEVPAAGSGMQKYLPLLLIVIIFLLVAVLIAVVFLMKK